MKTKPEYYTFDVRLARGDEDVLIVRVAAPSAEVAAQLVCEAERVPRESVLSVLPDIDEHDVYAAQVLWATFDQLADLDPFGETGARDRYGRDNTAEVQAGQEKALSACAHVRAALEVPVRRLAGGHPGRAEELWKALVGPRDRYPNVGALVWDLHAKWETGPYQ